MKTNPFLNAHVALPDMDVCCDGMTWNPHSVFAGVCLRHLVTGKETCGQFSAHLVRVEPGCALESHCHADNWEFHSVLSGSARCEVAGRTTEYGPGVCGVMPQGASHRVVAGDEGVYILATFVPAML